MGPSKRKILEVNQAKTNLCTRKSFQARNQELKRSRCSLDTATKDIETSEKGKSAADTQWSRTHGSEQFHAIKVWENWSVVCRCSVDRVDEVLGSAMSISLDLARWWIRKCCGPKVRGHEYRLALEARTKFSLRQLCFGCFHFCLFFIHFARSILVGHIGKVFLCRTRAIVLEWLGLYDIQWILEHIYTNRDCEMMKPGFDRDEKATNVGQRHPSAARREKLYGTRWRLSLPPHRLRARPSRHWKHMEAPCKHPVKS